MFQIRCSELTGEDCNFVTNAETKEEVKEKFFLHGANSPLHMQKYYSATEEEKVAFAKKLEDYLASQK